MMRLHRKLLAGAALTGLAVTGARANEGLAKIQHIIVVMQENHSFDNYMGVLPYVPGSPYHAPAGAGACARDDHACVDGLTCTPGPGGLSCTNSNPDLDGNIITAFHSATRCVGPDLDHGWQATHLEMNYENPNATLRMPLNDGFVRENQVIEPNGTPYGSISYFDQTDLPYYYALAQSFAISDRHFASLLGPTIPNRFYLMAATSFGHLTTDDTVPPPAGYQPITGTIFDLLDHAGVTWGDYFEDLGQASLFRPGDTRILPLQTLLTTLAGIGATLPQVVFVDPDFGLEGYATEDDEHPPTDIQRGQLHVSQVVAALRAGPYWASSVLFITHDEHGGFYDHVAPPRAQRGARTPDGIAPGQCEDLSNPPASEQPGGGAECAVNPLSQTDTDVLDAEALCPALALDPTGRFPLSCASFDQLGVRVPFMAISPFSRPHYVSHVTGDHTSILALIEKRFLTQGGVTAHLTARDAQASTTEDMFDFRHAPSLNTPVGMASPPVVDCTPSGSGAGGL